MQDAPNYVLQAAYDYLFTPEAYDVLKKQADRDRFWRTYWEERDPTPETEYNELLEEFFRRVEHTIFVFSRYEDFEDGWNSDMGHIYIIFGPPKDIYRSPTGPSLDPKYEVWVYRFGAESENQHSAELIFMEDTDNDDFELLTEIEYLRSIQNFQNAAIPKVIRQAEIN
jgi:GWxTD domain-containing protein